MRHKQENNLGKHGGLNTVNCNGTVVTSTMGKAVGQVTIGPRCVSFQVQSSIARCYHHGDDGTGVPFHCIVRMFPQPSYNSREISYIVGNGFVPEGTAVQQKNCSRNSPVWRLGNHVLLS